MEGDNRPEAGGDSGEDGDSTKAGTAGGVVSDSLRGAGRPRWRPFRLPFGARVGEGEALRPALGSGEMLALSSSSSEGMAGTLPRRRDRRPLSVVVGRVGVAKSKRSDGASDETSRESRRLLARAEPGAGEFAGERGKKRTGDLSTAEGERSQWRFESVLHNTGEAMLGGPSAWGVPAIVCRRSVVLCVDPETAGVDVDRLRID